MASLTSRAEAILAQAKKIDAYLEEKNIPYPSFEEDTLEHLPVELQHVRWSLANDSNNLKKLTRGVVMHPIDIIMGWTDALPLHIIYHYKLANAVPLHGSASYAEIAAVSGLSEALCLRFMRSAMGNNIFDEDPKTGRVRHTATSRLLATNQGLCDTVGLGLEEAGPAASKLPDVWEKYGANPDRARRFGGSMQWLTVGDSWELRHLLAAFDWASLDKPGATVVDIGGGVGTVSQYLARQTSNIHFTVQDLPHVVSTAPSKLPGDLKDRIDFAVHDFHKPQLSEPAPVAFFLRWVLHNWSDKYCISILRNLTPALRPGSKVLIYEYVLEDGPVTHLTGRFGFQLDMIMATLFNAQERSARDFERVLKVADERFILEGVRRPEGSTMSLVEVGWRG